MPTITLDQWQQVLALLVPFIVSFAVRAHWSGQVKRAVAVGLAALAAVVPALLQHQVQSATIVPEALVLITASQGFYHVFKPKFDALTSATTPQTQAPPVQPVRPPGA